MNMIPIQVTDEGVIIPKVYLHNAQEIELVVQADYVLLRPKETPPNILAEHKRRALAVAGRFHAGVADLAENHDTYLLTAYSGEA